MFEMTPYSKRVYRGFFSQPLGPELLRRFQAAEMSALEEELFREAVVVPDVVAVAEAV
ncbi:hypothetical protein LOK74_07835 [Brevibacillus humidisoli]|uniref:hypothetical protein n=1 Tax=Brevibacillus humidisoli TaxID=2895522 RepID=UPI001E4F174A|nr:hypothetical protein [Brevibacillus humidisoli]UFJ42385.1 hypothetical protein LOK74_07835 [Brevibacillus humidisoli]